VLNRSKERLWLQDHPGPAAKRHVVDNPVPVGRVIAQVVHAHIEASPCDRPPDDSFRERPLDHPGEDCHDVDLHHGLPCWSVFISDRAAR
jgi:hypothetical protein